jgi:hypothetical protein
MRRESSNLWILDMSNEDEVNQHLEHIFRIVIQQLYARSPKEIVARALLCLISRCANSWISIKTLRSHAPDKEVFMVDAGSLLRAVMDAYLQASYIVDDTEQRESRATDYFDFEHVEKYKSLEKFIKYDNWLSNRIKTSPRRAEGEMRVRNEYDRVKARFQERNGRTRNHWYQGSLFDLADSINRKEEYDLILSKLNGCVHSSASATLHGPPISPEFILDWTSTYTARVAILGIQLCGIELESLHVEMLNLLSERHF